MLAQIFIYICVYIVCAFSALCTQSHTHTLPLTIGFAAYTHNVREPFRFIKVCGSRLLIDIVVPLALSFYFWNLTLLLSQVFLILEAYLYSVQAVQRAVDISNADSL